MNGGRLWLFVSLLLLAACSPGAWPRFSWPGPLSAETALPADPADLTPTPTLAFPPRPTSVYTPRVFPSCEPAPVSEQPGSQAAASTFLTPVAPSTDATLRGQAERRGVLFGAAANTDAFQDPAYTTLLARQFNLVAPETAFRWDLVHPEPEQYDFHRADALIAFAQANDMSVYGYALIWDPQLPAWLTAESRSRDTWVQLLCRHIKTVVGRYRGQVYAWIVVNEPFQEDGQLRDTLWMRVIGPEYMAMALQWAHEADPQALLILNERSAEGLNQKSQAVVALAEGLLRQGAPLDGIGLQMHVGLWGSPTRDELLANMRRLAQLGLQAHITAMDVRIQNSPEGSKQKLAAQAETYRQALSACLSAPNCNVFITWGVQDGASPRFSSSTGAPDAALLFDETGAAKPAFDALLDVLKAGS